MKLNEASLDFANINMVVTLLLLSYTDDEASENVLLPWQQFHRGI